MNILFVCSRNIWRSPTAETVYKNRQDHKVKSAGTEPFAKVRVSSKDILWADIIFAMEKNKKKKPGFKNPASFQLDYFYTLASSSFFFSSKVILLFSLSKPAISISPFFTFIFSISSARGSSKYF